MPEVAAPAGETLTVNGSESVTNAVGPSFAPLSTSLLMLEQVAGINADPLAQPMATGDGSTAGTTDGATSDSESTSDSNGAYDIAWPLMNLIK